MSFIQSPFWTNKSENSHEGTINKFVIKSLVSLCFHDPPYQSKDSIFLNVALTPNIPPIQAKTTDVWTKLNHGPTTSSNL